MAKIGSLVIDLIAETGSFNANIAKASRNLNSEAAKMARSMESINAGINSVITAGRAFAGAAIVAEFAGLAQRGLDYASSLGEVSQQLGVTAQDLQVYRYAATQVGVSQEEMDKGLQKLTRSLGEAQLGSAKSGSVFKALGIDLRTANGDFKTASDVLPEIADRLAKIPDPARRAAIETQLFGKTGQQLDTLLSGGSAAIDELRTAASNLGLVLSDEQIQNADKTADKLAEVKKVLEARVAGAVADNAAAIYGLSDALLSIVGSSAKAVSALSDFYRGVDKVKADKGYLAFLTTPLNEFRGIGATERRMDSIMATRPEGLSFGTARPKLGDGLNIDGLLGSGGGRGRSGGGAKKAKDDVDDLSKSIADLRKENIRLLESNNVSGDFSIGGEKDLLKQALDVDDYWKQLRETTSGASELARINGEYTKKIGVDWINASQDVLYGLQSLKSGIEGGGFLDILGGVLDIFLSLGSVGVFGSNIQTNIKGARAKGGPVSGGGTYLVGEDGPELFTAGSSGMITPNDQLERIRRGAGFRNGGYSGGGFSRAVSGMERQPLVEIVPSPLFDVTIDGRAQAVAAPLAMRAAQAGSGDAQRSLAKKRRNRIPGR